MTSDTIKTSSSHSDHASIRVAINGFGRMGRLALRAAWSSTEFEIVHINEIAGPKESAAHLLEFDSVHGHWPHAIEVTDNGISVDDKLISYSSNKALEDTDWKAMNIDIVVECTGKFICTAPARSSS